MFDFHIVLIFTHFNEYYTQIIAVFDEKDAEQKQKQTCCEPSSCEMSGHLWAFFMDYLFNKYIGSLQKITKFIVLFCTLKHVAFLFCFTLEYKGNGVYCWNCRGFQIFQCKLNTHASSRGPWSTTVTTILEALQQMKFTTMNYGFLCYSLRVQGTWHPRHLE